MLLDQGHRAKNLEKNSVQFYCKIVYVIQTLSQNTFFKIGKEANGYYFGVVNKLIKSYRPVNS